MKRVVSLNRSIWLLMLLAVFGLLLPTVTSAFSPARSLFAYDEQNHASIAYDVGLLTAFNYDSAAVRVADEKEIGAAKTGGLFAQLAQFLAAKRGATAVEDVTYLYQKVGAEGEHLKFGITKNPATRYTQEELGGGQLRILTEGPRKDMLQLERSLHETLPIGPEEAQKFYIQKQIEKGLKPPPYNP